MIRLVVALGAALLLSAAGLVASPMPAHAAASCEETEGSGCTIDDPDNTPETDESGHTISEPTSTEVDHGEGALD